MNWHCSVSSEVQRMARGIGQNISCCSGDENLGVITITSAEIREYRLLRILPWQILNEQGNQERICSNSSLKEELFVF